PRDIFERYFTPHEQPGHYVLADVLRKSISFQQHDLSTLTPVRDNFRLVVCKNVLLHLSPEQRVGVLKMFHDSLCEGGFLAVEQTQKLPPAAERWFKPVSGCGPVFQKC
ncbi:chemotaxis protein CheR, partial [bacterium]|nr:chemotaxis protein CheR [bacterium]